MAHLQTLDPLRELRLYGTQISPQAVEQFQALAANVQVDFKAGAFLGVMCQQPPFPCQVFEVVADSAAAQGGIEVRDIIVRYGGNPITTFDDLRKQIGKNKVGDSVLIQVVRGGLPIAGQLEQKGNRDLGIEVEQLAYGVKITKLADGGAGMVAGLQIGDVLMEFNAEPVSTQDQLVKSYAALGEDDYVEFGAIRDTRVVSARVTFGEWTETDR